MARQRKFHFGFPLLLLLALTLAATGGFAVQYYFSASDIEADTNFVDGPADQFEYIFTRLAHNYPNLHTWQGHTWDTDYPKADRQFLQGVLRWTNIQARRQEQILRPLSPQLFAFPFVYAVEPGYWYLSEEEAARLREYLLRGGFLVVDDFHGTREWKNFEAQIRKVFPDRPIQEVELSDPIFHCFFDIEQKIQVPGLQFLYSGHLYEQDGFTPHYRAIYDDDHSIMVMINFNVDLGDAWEWSDFPQYPEFYTSYAFRLGVNYVVYAMTH
ncbi:MAG: DUF4159 domain-containing protein [Acidobacteria bacterium]|nr:DUF4159 domain-containing protein [Acidobacteriota bacterium]